MQFSDFYSVQHDFIKSDFSYTLLLYYVFHVALHFWPFLWVIFLRIFKSFAVLYMHKIEVNEQECCDFRRINEIENIGEQNTINLFGMVYPSMFYMQLCMAYSVCFLYIVFYIYVVHYHIWSAHFNWKCRSYESWQFSEKHYRNLMHMKEMNENIVIFSKYLLWNWCF